MSLRLTLILASVLAVSGVSCGEGSDGQAELPDDFSIAMERRICFGPCPVYRVTADASGRVTYQGERFVRVRMAEGRVTGAQLRGLLTVIEQIDFFDLEDDFCYGGSRCLNRFEDAPTVFLSVTRSGVEHELRHYHGCSGDPVLDELTEIELEIDQTLGTRDWVLCSPDDSFFYTSCEERFG